MGHQKRDEIGTDAKRCQHVFSYAGWFDCCFSPLLTIHQVDEEGKHHQVAEWKAPSSITHISSSPQSDLLMVACECSIEMLRVTLTESMQSKPTEEESNSSSSSEAPTQPENKKAKHGQLFTVSLQTSTRMPISIKSAMLILPLTDEDSPLAALGGRSGAVAILDTAKGTVSSVQAHSTASDGFSSVNAGTAGVLACFSGRLAYLLLPPHVAFGHSLSVEAVR